ncbi:MAG: hypothetical protein JNM56_33915 [Planctomycetia bacterium]|nr:hypothetical protein [Planctomycetia bacterium]
MPKKRLSLFWKDQLVGFVSDASVSDFPWVCGKFTVCPIPKELRAALEYIHRESNTDDGLQDWPFPEEFLDHWKIVQSDETARETSPPIIDFKKGIIDWR